MKKKYLSLITIALLSLSSCSFTLVDKVASVNIIQDDLTIKVNETDSLEWEVFPNYTSKKGITFSIEDPNIASVTNEGLVTGIKEGNTKATITTIEGNFTDSCRIIVENNDGIIPVSGIELSEESLSLFIDETVTLTASLIPENATNKNIVWSSSDNNIATVENGIVTTKAIGETNILARTMDGDFVDSCIIQVIEESLQTLFFNVSTPKEDLPYNSNCVLTNINSGQYGYYRAKNLNNGFITLKDDAREFGYNYNNIEGQFFNNIAIRGIRKMNITYQSDAPIDICYGQSRTKENKQTLNGSKSFVSELVTFPRNTAYFSIATTNSPIDIKEIEIQYNSICEPINTLTDINDFRINPTIYEGILEDGVSQVTIPTKIDINEGDLTYDVLETKTYTYYSFEYCKTHLDVLDKATMIDPIDVANYYIAFNSIPANYGNNGSNRPDQTYGSEKEVKDLFGKDARRVTQYTREDGYAQSVPYRSNPIYYEFDIGLDSFYSTSSRDTGRLVMWRNGWSCYDHNVPVATFTDDHYATFAEYLNYGAFTTHFDGNISSSGYVTGYIMPSKGSITLSLSNE